MTNVQIMVAFLTIVRREIRRFMRIWPQTLLPPAITMTLYFAIFGNLIGSRIGQMGGFSYMEYIVPGLIMMSIITNSYANVSASFYSAKFQHNVQELLVSPTPNWIILTGYVVGGVTRGLLVGFIVTLLSLFFTNMNLENIFITIIVVFLTAVLFSLGGFVNAVYAKSFDDISIIPTFVLVPLTYLGGVFYSIDLLPEFWQNMTLLNPVLYMVNAFRFGVLGVSDINVAYALVIIVAFIVVLFSYALRLLNRGHGIRS
jgi:ABC-2 type transport system permease protein